MSWKPKGRVVVPVDFSPSSASSIREAIEMVSEASEVSVLHVLPKLDYVSPGVLWGDVNDESRLLAACSYLDKFLADHEIDGVRFDVVIGDPGTRIIEFADDCHADLILIPSHGYHGMKRMYFGSVAERVIRHAHCPVFIPRRLDAD